MTRARVVGASLGLVALAVASALVAARLWPPRQDLGPVPAEALALPADAAFVMGLDLRTLVASPLVREHPELLTPDRFSALREFAELTGLDPLRDVDKIVIAGDVQSGVSVGALMLIGHFDVQKIEVRLSHSKGFTATPHAGSTLFTPPDGSAPGSLAALGPGTLVLGHPAWVRSSLENRTSGVGLAADGHFIASHRQLRKDATFWLVGGAKLAKRLPGRLPLPGSGGSHGAITLPSLRRIVVSGVVDSQLALEVAGEALDETSATNLADMLRGLVALAALRAKVQPELARLAEGFHVTQTDTLVQVTASLPPPAVEALIGSLVRSTTADAGGPSR